MVWPVWDYTPCQHIIRDRVYANGQNNISVSSVVGICSQSLGYSRRYLLRRTGNRGFPGVDEEEDERKQHDDELEELGLQVIYERNKEAEMEELLSFCNQYHLDMKSKVPAKGVARKRIAEDERKQHDDELEVEESRAEAERKQHDDELAA
ncbi:hypothetical protein HID58_028354 [Brassica napus]|uniref:Uncharacterized protein n=1 Tax=Brassica napus TaxID=3708 RepID=A0ABQ8CA48_BRANA|nr:hypothetical protein HID58_028354 [Brassica napus]